MNLIDMLMRQNPLIKVVSVVVLGLLITLIYWQVFYKPVITEVKALEPELSTLKQELSMKQAIVSERPKYEAELEQTRHELVLALKQLPDKSEIPSLLENVSALGKSSGLNILLVRPKAEVSKNFYAEIPVDLKLEGTYRDVVNFFDKVSKMPRIVNISEISMGTPKRNSDGQTVVQTTCLATTYKFIEGVNKPDEVKNPGEVKKP